MTIIAGIDPGSSPDKATTGWCFYNPETKVAQASGIFGEADAPEGLFSQVEVVVIEKPIGYGPTRPTVVAAAIVAGRLYERCHLWQMAARSGSVQWMSRREVYKLLTLAVDGVIHVRSDATAWAALLELHGGPTCAKKGGCLYGVRSHARAALAVAVAWSLQHQPTA